MNETKYLEKLLGGNKDTYIAKNTREGVRLFNVFYDLPLIKKAYKKQNSRHSNHKLTYSLLYGAPERIKFHSVVFSKNDSAIMVLYRNYFGPALDDYADLHVEFNDYEILNFKHMSPMVKEQLEQNYNKHMVKKFGNKYIDDGLHYFKDKANKSGYTIKGYAFEKATSPEKSLNNSKEKGIRR